MEAWWVCLVRAEAMEETQLLSDTEFEAENEEEKHSNFSLFPLPISCHCLLLTAPRQKPYNIGEWERKPAGVSPPESRAVQGEGKEGIRGK